MGVVRRRQLKKVITLKTAMTEKRSSVFFTKKYGWHRQLPPRVTPTLVTPLCERDWWAGELNHEADSKDNVMHIETSDYWFLNRKRGRRATDTASGLDSEKPLLTYWLTSALASTSLISIYRCRVCRPYGIRITHTRKLALLLAPFPRTWERENFIRHSNRNKKTSNGTKVYMRGRLSERA